MFYPALNGFQGEMCKVRKMYYPEEYTQAQSDEEEKFDIALVELDKNFGDKYGFFKLDYSHKSKGNEAYIYGYPGEVRINGVKEDGGMKMFGMKGQWEVC